MKNKFTTLSTLTTGLQAVATILSAVRVITVSLKSIASTSPNEESQENNSEQNHKSSGRGLHKWIIVAGAVVGLITIAYLENMISNFKQKKQNVPKEQPVEERFESVYVNS
ncbi:MAG: hypothetical protein ACRD38_05085 [Nitrososphaerales archaeon]